MPEQTHQATANQNDLRQQLAASEARFQQLIQQIADGVIVVDDDGLVRFLNPAARRLLHRGDDFVGEIFGYPVAGEDFSEVDIIVDGDVVAIAEMRVVEIVWEGKPAYLATLRDVTARKLAQTELQRTLDTLNRTQRQLHGKQVALQQALTDVAASERKYAHLFDFAPIAYFSLDNSLLIEEVNLIAAEMLGYGQEALLGCSFLTLMITPPDEDISLFFDSLRTDMVTRREITFKRANGKRFPTMLQSIRIIGLEDVGIYYQVTVIDLSAQKQAEQDRINYHLEQEKVRLLADFVRDVSHEFRTPLSVINTELYLIKRRIQTGGLSTDQVSVVKSQVDYLATLVEAMLTLSRLDSGEDFYFHPLDLNQMVRTLADEFRPLAVRQGLQLALHESEIAPIRADGQKLHQALRALLENALRYTPSEGQIKLRTYREDDSVIFEVQDTGIGIAEDDLPHIFTRFFRADRSRSTRGVGLGLTIAERIINAHGGEIIAESTPDVGSTFCVRLPVDHHAG